MRIQRKSKSLGVIQDLVRDVTRFYLFTLQNTTNNLLKNTDTSYSFKLAACNTVKDIDRVMELYRHSLCLFFDFESTLDYKDIEPLVILMVNSFKTNNNLNRFKETYIKDENMKKGFIQACVHSIVMTRNLARGYENG